MTTISYRASEGLDGYRGEIVDGSATVETTSATYDTREAAIAAAQSIADQYGWTKTYSLQQRRGGNWPSVLRGSKAECVAEMERIRARAQRDPGERAAVDSGYRIVAE